MATTIPPTFQGYQYEAFGDFDQVVKFNPSIQQTKLNATQVRIKLHSAGLNPIDYKFIAYGPHFTPLRPSADQPFGVGYDFTGTLVEIGVDVKGFEVGDVVFGMGGLDQGGAFAEYYVVDAKYVAPKPKTLTFNEAAGVPCVAQTSWQALVDHCKLKAGDRLLILGGSTSCGLFAIQIAKALGAFVVATSSFRNTELVKSIGADQVIDYTKEKWVEVIQPYSIDVVFDCGVEPNAWNDEAQKVLKKDGDGQFATTQPIADAIESPIHAKKREIYCMPSGACLEKITELIHAGKIRVPIDSVHSFEKMMDAMQIQKSNRARGKIILEIASDNKL